jgi:hypothetical protein
MTLPLKILGAIVLGIFWSVAAPVACALVILGTFLAAAGVGCVFMFFFGGF